MFRDMIENILRNMFGSLLKTRLNAYSIVGDMFRNMVGIMLRNMFANMMGYMFRNIKLCC